MKAESNSKDTLILKLCQTIDEQEKYITHFKVKTKNEVDGRLSLFNFKDYSFSVEGMKKQITQMF